MRARHLLSTALAASLIAVPVTRAQADAGDFVAGAIVGGVLGHVATRAQPQRVYRAPTRTYRGTRTTTKKVYRPRLPATSEGRQIQTSLNYFGFNAGGVDGQLGRQSRSAISAYQAYMGYPATGQLTPFEQDLLVNSYNRAQAGGGSTQSLIAQTPDGTRGLLKRFRTEMAGGTTTTAAAPMAPAPAIPSATVVVAPMAAAAPAAAAAALEADEPVETAAAPALPNFFGSGEDTGASLASHCNKVSLVTNSNGGFATADTMTDASFALSEQFCLARTYAIADGEELIEGLGVGSDTIAENCAIYEEQLSPHVAALSIKESDAVIRDVAGFVLESGVPARDLEGTARICLSVGYRTDNMQMALGSALLLTTLGQKGYGELMGHHLSEGFGTAERGDLSLAWYRMGVDAAEAGQDVFAPGQTGRTELIRKAAFKAADQAEAAPAETPEVKPVQAALPTFAIAE